MSLLSRLWRSDRSVSDTWLAERRELEIRKSAEVDGVAWKWPVRGSDRASDACALDDVVPDPDDRISADTATR